MEHVSKHEGLFLDTNIPSLSLDKSKPPRISVEETTPITPVYKHSGFSVIDSAPASPVVDALPHLNSFSSNASSTQNPNRARNESRKLLAHLLMQLLERPMPPSVFDSFRERGSGGIANGFGAVVKTVKVRLQDSRQNSGLRSPPIQPSVSQSDTSDDEDNAGTKVFSTDYTLDLMIQLKDVLVMSDKYGWQIFYDSFADEINSQNLSSNKLTSPFRRRRQSFQSFRRRSRSPSRVPETNVQAPELLSRCIAVLSSIITEDCRFQISSPRPSRPNNALQAITLEVAQFLTHTHRYDPQVIAKIAFAVFPAFSTFHVEMHTRLLAFYEESIVRGVLEDLSHAQGTNTIFAGFQSNAEAVAPQAPDVPVVSIEVVEESNDANSKINNCLDWIPWSSSTTAESLAVVSTNAPQQQLAVYYLASIIPPLLAAILENIDFSSYSLPTSHRFYRLLKLVVEFKPDSYLDILQVIAYHTEKARLAAISVLATFWPRAIGHVVVSKAPFVVSYNDTVRQADVRGSKLLQTHEDLYAHQFVPWQYSTVSRAARLEGFNPKDCHTCSNRIEGFGLLCPFCMCCVHFDCYDYPDGSFSYQCNMTDDSNMKKVVIDRYCYIQPTRRDHEMETTERGRHTFRLANLFTVSLCWICRTPLWGCVAQGLKCITCRQSVHSSCLDGASPEDLSECRPSDIDSSFLTIEWTDLRRSFVDSYRELFLSQQDLELRTYEEISVFSSVLSTQLQLLKNGVALGTIIISQKHPASPDKQSKVDKFELHYLVDLYTRYLSSGRPPISPAMEEYLIENRLKPADHNIFYDWSALIYALSVIKSPHASHEKSGASPEFLNVSSHEEVSFPDVDIPSHPYEVLSLAQMRDALGYEFHLFHDAAARLFLSHLHQLGFLDRMDRDLILFHGNVFNAHHEQAFCVCPLPLGLDLSADVETLVAAVEACLLDIDVAVNEAGFLLLVRKFWPNGMASNYALRRLTRIILSWVFLEDDNLATILRDYVPQGRALPGVRPALESLPWPLSQNNRFVPGPFQTNGGDYVASRRALLQKYGSRWLLALHDQDGPLYAEMVYELCVELSEEMSPMDMTPILPGLSSANDNITMTVTQIDGTLRCLMKLCQKSVTFDVFDDIFLKWLESISDLYVYDEGIPSLFRLLNRETDSTQRYSSMVDGSSSATDSSDVIPIDPWRVILTVAAADKEGISRSVRWLYLFSRSGVDIPVAIYTQFCQLMDRFDCQFPDAALLVQSVLSSTWLKSIGRQNLQGVFRTQHVRMASYITKSLEQGNGLDKIVTFIRQSLASCLLLYGCERQTLLHLRLVLEQDIHNLPSRRKLSSRVSMMSDPITVDREVMNILDSYMNVKVDEVSCLIGLFFHMFINESPLLESYEVDNFILRNGPVLCSCAWELYGIQDKKIVNIRPLFLLRVLVVDSEPFQSILRGIFESESSWEVRFEAVNRLFLIVLDVTSPAFRVEGRQWRSSVAEIFCRFFSAVWIDEKETVRTAADTLSQNLLPAHQEVITQCWCETLAKVPIPERVQLVSFLIQLHPHFPRWQLLSWEAIVESLLEDDYLRRNGPDEDAPAAAHLSMYGIASAELSMQNADPDLMLLLTSIVSLSLHMIADGIPIDFFSLQKVKEHLAYTVGLDDVSIVSAPQGQGLRVQVGRLTGQLSQAAFPCVADLLGVLDASHSFALTTSAMRNLQRDEIDSSAMVLVGSVFVDVALVIINDTDDLLSLPILTAKSLLECLLVMLYKHDFDAVPLKHLHSSLREAVRRCLSMCLVETSSEIRQLALACIQAYVKRWSMFASPFTCECIEGAAKLIISLAHNSEDVLVAQARSFIASVLTTLSSSSILVNLCRRELDRRFFEVIKYIIDSEARAATTSSENIRDILVRDALLRAPDTEYKFFQLVVNNVCTFIEIVHHEHYSSDLLQVTGSCLSEIATRSSEFSADEFDINPLLKTLVTLINSNRAICREILGKTEIILRIALIRFHVNTESLSHLLRTTSPLYRRNMSSAEASSFNKIDENIIEIVVNGLRMRARVSSITLTALVEAITMTDVFLNNPTSSPYAATFSDMADAGLHFLCAHTWTDVRSQNDFQLSLTVAKMVLHVSVWDPAVFDKWTTTEFSQERSKQVLNIRAWNFLLFGALSTNPEEWTPLLFSRFHAFSSCYFSSLQSYTQVLSGLTEILTAEINHAYAAIKLWLMVGPYIGVSHSYDKAVNREDMVTHMIWNGLWPPFECLVNQFEKNASTGIIPPLATSTWASVADLFLFVRQTRSIIGLETSSQVILLERLRRYGRKESTNDKFYRTLRQIAEPAMVASSDVLLTQLSNDIVAAEKLQALEGRRRDMGR